MLAHSAASAAFAALLTAECSSQQRNPSSLTSHLPLSSIARTELRIGKFYSDQQLYTAAALRFRAAFAILAKDPVARSQIVPEQIASFIATAAVLAREPRQRPLLDAEIFQAVQFVESDVAGQTIVRASARLAAGNPSLADLIRQAQEAQRQRDNFRVELAAEYAKPDDERRRARDIAKGAGSHDPAPDLLPPSPKRRTSAAD